MKTIFKSVLTLGLVAGLGFAANAQVAATSPASATILSELTIARTGDINFGVISNTSGAGVVLDANGVTNVNTGNDRSVARFDVTGDNGASITVNYDPTVDLVFTGTLATLGSPVASEIIVMTPEVVGTSIGITTADQAVANTISQAGTVAIGTGGVSGQYYIWVGGSLATSGPYAAGDYDGTFNINVEYN
jgi:hypothetical protein